MQRPATGSRAGSTAAPRGESAARIAALEAALADRTRELDQALEALARARVAPGVVPSALSHELKTPLTAILGFSDLLLAGLEGPLSDAQREDVESIARSGRRLLTVVDELVAAGTVAEPKPVLPGETADVA